MAMCDQQRDILDLAAARKMVSEILLSAPDRVFGATGGRACMYFYANGQPSCVVGHVLARLGFNREMMRKGDGGDGGRYDLNSVKFYALREIVKDKITPDAERFLNVAQAYQDQGKSWGEVHGILFPGEAGDSEAAS